MARDGTIQIAILGDASSYQRALRTAGIASSRFGGTLRRVGRYAAIGLAGTGVALAAAGKAAVDASEEAAGIAAQVRSVIKSTGGVANVSAGQVEKLANSIMGYSGISDEAIQNSSKVLLTFKKIQNEAGKGNSIFDRATKSVANLSSRMGTDLKSAALQVGKALNDPNVGLTALRRSGVSFTEQQGEMIKRLFDSGKRLKAQKMILRELKVEFGGAAKAAGSTFTGQLNILRETVGNLLEDVGKKLVPVLQKLLPDVAKVLETTVKTLGPILIQVADALGKALVPVIKALAPVLEQLGKLFAELARVAAPVIEILGRQLARTLKALMPALRPLVRELGEAFLKALKAIAPSLPKMARSITRIVKALTPLIPIVADVAAKFLEWQTKNGAKFIDWVSKNLVPIIETIVSAVKLTRKIWRLVWAKMEQVVGEHGAGIKGFIDDILGPLEKLLELLGGLKGILDKLRGSVPNVNVPKYPVPPPNYEFDRKGRPHEVTSTPPTTSGVPGRGTTIQYSINVDGKRIQKGETRRRVLLGQD